MPSTWWRSRSCGQLVDSIHVAITTIWRTKLLILMQMMTTYNESAIWRQRVSAYPTHLNTCVPILLASTYPSTYLRTYTHTRIRTCIHTYRHYIHNYIHTCMEIRVCGASLIGSTLRQSLNVIPFPVLGCPRIPVGPARRMGKEVRFSIFR